MSYLGVRDGSDHRKNATRSLTVPAKLFKHMSWKQILERVFRESIEREMVGWQVFYACINRVATINKKSF